MSFLCVAHSLSMSYIALRTIIFLSQALWFDNDGRIGAVGCDILTVRKPSISECIPVTQKAEIAASSLTNNQFYIGRNTDITTRTPTFHSNEESCCQIGGAISSFVMKDIFIIPHDGSVEHS
jgi:hypothetical protein